MTDDKTAWLRLVCESTLPPNGRLVCFVVGIAADAGGVSVVAPSALSRMTGLSKRTAAGHLRRAAAAGLLRVEREQGRVACFLTGKIESAPAPAPTTRIEVEAGDPRWEAWLAAYVATPSTSAWARQVRRWRVPLQVDADWPAPSAEIEESGFGSFRMPWGTPEYAAWLQHWRRTGRARQAQAADVGRHPIFEKHRWPPLAALEEASA